MKRIFFLALMVIGFSLTAQVTTINQNVYGSNVKDAMNTNFSNLQDSVDAVATTATGESVSTLRDSVVINTTQFQDSLGWFNVVSYGAVSGGDSEDQTAINSAISAAYDETTIKTSIVYIPPGEWYISAPVKLRDGVHIEVAKGATFDFPDNYTGAVYTTDTVNISSPTRNGYIRWASVNGGYYRGDGKICSWDLIDLRANDLDSSRQVYCVFENMYARDLNRGINAEITNDGWIHGNMFRNITLINPKIAVRARGGAAGVGFEDNIFDFLQVQWGDSTLIGLDTLEQGRSNEFRHLRIYDVPTDSIIAVLGADYDANLFIGGNITGSGIDNSVWIDNGDENRYYDTRTRRGEVRLDTISEVDGIDFYDIYDPFYPYPEHITLIYTGDDPVNITADPQISETSIPDGQILTVMGTDNTNYLYLDHGTGLNLMGGIDFQLGAQDNVTLMYNAFNGIWTELGRSSGTAGLVSARDIMLNGSMNFAVDVQGNDDYEVTIAQLKQLAVGLMVTFIANTANTDGATLEISAVGSQDAILKMNDQPLVTGDIEAGQVVQVVWDGSNHQMISPVAQ